MNSIAAQEIKRRGINAVAEQINHGPVHLIKNNKPLYVLMSERDYDQMIKDLAEARLAASMADVKAGRTRRGSARELISEIRLGAENAG